MTSTKIYNYDTPSEYNYDDTDIKVVSGSASLLLNPYPNQSFTEDYSSDTGFVYDSDEAEFVAGVLQQADQAPTNGSAFANYEVDEDLTWGDSAFAGTLFGGATVASGKLNLKGTGDRGCSYVITGSINAKSGAIRLLWIPNYTGNPSTTNVFFDLANTDGSNNNRLRFYHDTASAVRMDSYTNVGVGTTNTPFGTLSVTAGVEYIIEFNWDFTTGSEEHRVFVNGIQQGGTQATAKTRDDNLTSVTHLEIGGTNADYEVGYMLTANAPLNTTAHTAPDEPSAIRYLETYILSPLETASGAPEGTLVSLEAWDVTGSANSQFTFNDADGNAFWYNHANEKWESSDTSYAQSNPSSDIVDHLVDFPLEPGTTDFKYGIVFPSSNTIQENIDNLEVTYTSQIYLTTNPIISVASCCRIWSEEMLTFLADETILGSDNITYILSTNGSKMYWDGAAWSASNGTYAQSNTSSEIVTNISTLISSRKQIGLEAFLHSDDGLTTPLLNTNTFTYDEALPDPERLPRLVDINGYIYDNDGPAEGVEIKVRPYVNGFNNPNDNIGGGVFHVYDWRLLATALSDGYFSGGVYLQPTGEYWEFKINKQRYKTQLLDQDANDFNELTIELVEN